MSWLDDAFGDVHPPLQAWQAWITQEDQTLIEAMGLPGSPFSAAAIAGLIARLAPVEGGTWAQLQARAAPSARYTAIRAWLAEQTPEFWASVAEDASLAVEAADARIQDLDTRYEPGDPVWRRLFQQLLRQRDTLANVAWSAAVAQQRAAWRADLVQLDDEGQRLLDGALDLYPVEDSLLSRLDGDGAWWLDSGAVIPLAEGAHADWSVAVLPPATPRAEFALAADDAPLAEEGLPLGTIGLVTVQYIPQPGGHVIRVSGPLDLPFALDEPGRVELRTLADGPARVERMVYRPRLWAERLLEPGAYVLRVGDQHLRLQLPGVKP